MKTKALRCTGEMDMLSIMSRQETYVGFDAGVDLKRRILKVTRETGRSMAQIMRAFTEVGLAEYYRGGDKIFWPGRKGAIDESQNGEGHDT
jgi:hypothetical protein